MLVCSAASRNDVVHSSKQEKFWSSDWSNWEHQAYQIIRFWHGGALGLSLGIKQFYGLRLSLEVETQMISILDLVYLWRLRKIQFRTWSGNWDWKNTSLGLSLEIPNLVLLISDLNFGNLQPFSIQPQILCSFNFFPQVRLSTLVCSHGTGITIMMSLICEGGCCGRKTLNSTILVRNNPR